MPSSGVWGLLFPSDRDLYRGVVQSWFKRARHLVKKEIKIFNALKNRSLDNLHSELQRFLKEYTFELGSMADALTRVASHYQSAQRHASEIQTAAVRKAESTRSALIEEFGKQVTGLQEKIVEEINRWNSVISCKKKVLKEEGAAVGMDL